MPDVKIRGIIFGVGNYWRTVKPYLAKRLDVFSYMDNNIKFSPEGNTPYLPSQWRELDFDKIIICAGSYHAKLEMMNQLLDLGVGKERIGFIEEFLINYNISIEAVKQNVVVISANGVHVQCENEIEYMIAQEIFAGEGYGFHSKEEYFVVDIGLNIGCTALYFASKNNITTVYGFEPCKPVYEKASNNISDNDKTIRDKISIFNIGLGGTDRIEKFTVLDGIDESRGFKIVQDNAENKDHIVELEVRQASNVLSEIFQKHNEKCLLKIDCEGAEYEILEDLICNNTIKRVDSIVMEWHDGKYAQLAKLLEEAGFKYLLTKSCRDFGMCYAWK